MKDDLFLRCEEHSKSQSSYEYHVVYLTPQTQFVRLLPLLLLSTLLLLMPKLRRLRPSHHPITIPSIDLFPTTTHILDFHSTAILHHNLLPQPLLQLPPQLRPARHLHLTPPSLPPLYLRLYLIQRIIDLPPRIIRQPKDRQVTRLLTHRFCQMRMVPRREAFDEVRLGWGSEERHGNGYADDGVEVDVRPEAQRVLEVEDDEGRGAEAEGELRGEVAGEVVVDLVAGAFFAVGRREEGPDVAAEILGYGLDEGGEDEGEIVAGLEAVPKGGGGEGEEAGAKAGFLALRGDAEVDVVAEPIVGVFVPVFEVCAGVLGQFDAQGVDVLEAVP